MNDDRPSGVVVAPAPWLLTGQGAIVVVRLPRAQLEHECFIPADSRLAGSSRIAYLMFVDYASSDVGPYHELLFIPGRLRFGSESRLSITRIFVSTWASVDNGQHNWGIPKDRCDFDVRHAADGSTAVVLTARDGSRFAEVELQGHGPRLPAPGHWIPAAWRTLSQVQDGRRYTYAPEANGHFRFAKLRRWRFDARHFPDLARGQVLGAIQLTDFRMTFPVAIEEPF